VATLYVKHPRGQAVGYQKLTVDSTSGGVGLTLPDVSPAPDAALVTVETAGARYKVTGAPSATEGHLVGDGDAFCISGNQLSEFRAFRTSGTSATFHVTYYRNLEA